MLSENLVNDCSEQTEVISLELRQLGLLLIMNRLAATAFGENWTLFVRGLKDWKPPLPDPPDIIILYGASFISLLFACYILRMVTAGHWTEYRGAWVPVLVMILLFLVGFAGLVTIYVCTH